jgi:hypothetical protein
MTSASPRSLTIFKWLLTLGAAIPVAAYLAFLRAHHRLYVESGLLNIHAGDYHFSYQLDVISAIECLGAAVFFAFYGLRDVSRPRDAAPRLARAVFTALVTTGLLLLVWSTWLGRVTRIGEEVLIVSAVGALAGWLLTMPDGPGLWLARLGDAAERTPRWLIVIVGFIVGALVAHGSWVLLHGRQTIVTDAQSQISQARLLLSGHFIYPISQQLRDVLEIPYALLKVPSYSQFPPGYILALVPAIAAGFPAQTTCTLAAGFMVALTAWLVIELAGRVAGWVAITLFAGSTFFWIMGGTAMNHVFCAALLIAALCCWLPLINHPDLPLGRWRIVAGGLALGWAITTRPLTGLAHGALWGAVILTIFIASLRRGSAGWTRALPRRVVPWAIVGLAIPAAVFMFYNTQTTGHALKMAYETSNPTGHVLGFRTSGPVPYSGADAVNHLFASIFSLNELMLGWMIGSWLGLLVWWKRTRLSRAELILAGLVLAQVFCYSLYHFYDLFLGPRFLFELLPILLILTVMGMAPVLQRSATARGATLLVLLIFGFCSTVTILTGFNRYYTPLRSGIKLEEFMNTIEPLRRPTVVLISAPYNEMVGRWYPAIGNEQPVYFVLKSKEKAARALPELRKLDWVEMK